VLLLPGIHRLKEGLDPVFDDPTCWTSIYLVVADRTLLVDTGVPRSARARVLPYLESIGLRAEQVDLIVNTHGHGDHVGSNAELRDLCRAEIWIHQDDAGLLAGGQSWGEEAIAPHRPDRVLRGGDVIDLGSRALEVVHLPGHTHGSIGLFDRAAATLICGDSLQGLGTSVQNLALVFHPDAYERTVELARALPVEWIVPAHPYWPLADSCATGADLRRFLDVSAQFVAEIDGRLLDALRSQREPATVPELSERVCRAFGRPGSTALAEITVASYLERLVARGRATAGGSGARRRYGAA
jgi:glyoxylase-like metal-dependent hydrolase (beta-lactamase superfamily II)